MFPVGPTITIASGAASSTTPICRSDSWSGACSTVWGVTTTVKHSGVSGPSTRLSVASTTTDEPSLRCETVVSLARPEALAVPRALLT